MINKESKRRVLLNYFIIYEIIYLEISSVLCDFHISQINPHFEKINETSTHHYIKNKGTIRSISEIRSKGYMDH